MSMQPCIGSCRLCLHLECRKLAAVGSGRAPSPHFGAWVTGGRVSGTLVLDNCVNTKAAVTGTDYGAHGAIRANGMDELGKSDSMFGGWCDPPRRPEGRRRRPPPKRPTYAACRHRCSVTAWRARHWQSAPPGRRSSPIRAPTTGPTTSRQASREQQHGASSRRRVLLTEEAVGEECAERRGDSEMPPPPPPGPFSSRCRTHLRAH